jgi:hypothetical protein
MFFDVSDQTSVVHHQESVCENPLDREEPVQELEAQPEVNKVDKGEDIMSDKDEQDFNSLLSALNDLPRG